MGMLDGLIGNALAGIMAHEHAHILQFSNGIRGPGQSLELHADFMAGWYMGFKVLAGTPSIDIRVLATSLFNKGDYDFNSPQHHWTPQQRVQVMAEGFRVALGGVRSAGQALRLGANMLRL